MSNKDRFKHLKSLQKPDVDKNFSFVLSASDIPDKLDGVKDSIKDVKGEINKMSEKIDEVKQNMVFILSFFEFLNQVQTINASTNKYRLKMLRIC